MCVCGAGLISPGLFSCLIKLYITSKSIIHPSVLGDFSFEAEFVCDFQSPGKQVVNWNHEMPTAQV